ncbi:hypothetical protein CBR_g37351 [Chara braunii]|uniref:Uncharacterized protein n=1 Tax=Chara braunii TaxID=69332 RepID=A0A388JZS4_CHABU|nr:hypothetical protein CBR_g37351 [Chara braunii]|eukprot:GBG63265.1 hypothetical protein CBR_g37351 [Chara braunii]
MVETRSGTSTSPYTQEQQEKMAALVRENKERKELLKQAKLKTIAEEQATKMKKLEEEMKRVQQEEEERRKAADEEAAAEEEKERMRIESREGSSGTKKDEDCCEGAIEGAKVITAAEGKARPRKEPVKLKFPDAHGGKSDENFDNWEASINSYIYLQHIVQYDQVLVAFQALEDEAASFARSLARVAGCENNMVAYSKVTPLPQFFKLLRERFADLRRGVRASDKLQTIHSRQWRSAKALKAVIHDLVAVTDHGVIESQLVQLFYRAMPEPLRGHFFDKSQQPTMTYDALSREVMLFEAKSMPVTTFWHKDLDKGKKWKGRTISGQVRVKDHMILTVEEGGIDEVPYRRTVAWGRGGPMLLSPLEGGRKVEEEAEAKGARPWEAEDRAHKGLADKGTAKWEVGVKVPRQIAKVLSGPHSDEVEGHLKEDGTQACHRAGLGRIWAWTSVYGKNA